MTLGTETWNIAGHLSAPLVLDENVANAPDGIKVSEEFPQWMDTYNIPGR